MVQNACVVIQQLNKDIPPETAQPLAILEHGSGAVGSLISRLERPHLHVCNGSDQAYRNTSGKADLRLKILSRCQGTSGLPCGRTADLLAGGQVMSVLMVS